LVPQTEEDILDIKWVPIVEIESYLSRSYESIEEIIRKWLADINR